MKRRLFGRSLLAVAVLGSACCSDSSEPLYKDVSQPVERRIDDLMGRMTLREKIGQMCQFVGLEHLRMAGRNATPEEIRDGHAPRVLPGLPLDRHPADGRGGRGQLVFPCRNPRGGQLPARLGAKKPLADSAHHRHRRHPRQRPLQRRDDLPDLDRTGRDVRPGPRGAAVP